MTTPTQFAQAEHNVVVFTHLGLKDQVLKLLNEAVQGTSDGRAARLAVWQKVHETLSKFVDLDEKTTHDAHKHVKQIYLFLAEGTYGQVSGRLLETVLENTFRRIASDALDSKAVEDELATAQKELDSAMDKVRKDALITVVECIERLKAGAKILQDIFILEEGSRTTGSGQARVRFAGARELHGILGRAEGAMRAREGDKAALALRNLLVQPDGKGGYDSPKLAAAILELARQPYRRQEMFIRLDDDVKPTVEGLMQLKERYFTYVCEKDSPLLGKHFCISWHYLTWDPSTPVDNAEGPSAGNFEKHYLNDYSIRTAFFPRKPCPAVPDPDDPTRLKLLGDEKEPVGIDILRTGYFIELFCLGHWGSNLNDVISGAGLCSDVHALRELPPWTNADAMISWIDDYAKWLVMQDYYGGTFDKDTGMLGLTGNARSKGFPQERRDDVVKDKRVVLRKNIGWSVNVYLDRLLMGCILAFVLKQRESDLAGGVVTTMADAAGREDCQPATPTEYADALAPAPQGAVCDAPSLFSSALREPGTEGARLRWKQHEGEMKEAACEHLRKVLLDWHNWFCGQAFFRCEHGDTVLKCDLPVPGATCNRWPWERKEGALPLPAPTCEVGALAHVGRQVGYIQHVFDRPDSMSASGGPFIPPHGMAPLPGDAPFSMYVNRRLAELVWEPDKPMHHKLVDTVFQTLGHYIEMKHRFWPCMVKAMDRIKDDWKAAAPGNEEWQWMFPERSEAPEGDRPTRTIHVAVGLIKKEKLPTKRTEKDPDRYLMIWNARWQAMSFVGGGIEKERDEDDPRHAVAREVNEEVFGIHGKDETRWRVKKSGCKELMTFDRVAFSGRKQTWTEYIFYVYEVTLPEDSLVIQKSAFYSPEHEEGAPEDVTEWVSADDIRCGYTPMGRPIMPTLKYVIEELGKVAS